ncbi:RNA polymerase sigma-70 factor, ECF subfamily [Pustulibacterium marinum]|uniref:RNA polymerase sigma-70 factor, ECF subfamily n=1 Tax=Pustulibacterium marinum TaxID=1224947 RepID=A0A1I7FMR6_9FLAO|nr:RNA polymerase sigma factor [Pustulibacterium marinum]SFU37499.1 RNA polymerase sigma-70 factor, ECF subfamily [Pustulibacterium marinum]
MKITEKEFLDKINAHKGIIYKVSRMYFDEPEDREDLFQEIIFQLWKSVDSFKGNSQFSSWMYRVALNTAIVFYKKQRKRIGTTADLKTEPVAPKDYDGVKDKQLGYFYKAIRQLDKIDKALILLYIEGYSGKEIAETLGLSETNTRVKTNRVKKQLKEIIKTEGYEF